MRYLFYLAFILSLASPLTAQLFDVTKKLKGDTTGLAAGEEVTQYSFTVGGTGSASREGKSGAGQIGIQAWKNGRFFSTLLLNIAANNRFNNNDSSQISIYL
ncbi:MAG: hypothetical protein DWQ10_18730 [Calditrichaeota bacterium]|nr:MAG: hypothetical protein DWQ10_18730 [Calditrichota bacterium]